MFKGDVEPHKECAPPKWSVLDDRPEEKGENFVFRHGCEVVREICSKMSRPEEFWLDVGCGSGHLSASLSRMGLSVIGIDHDNGMACFAKARFLKESINGRIKFIAASAYHLPLECSVANGLVAVSLMGCLSSPEMVFMEIYRVLRMNGLAIITFTSQTSVLLKMKWFGRKVKGLINKSVDDGCYRLYLSSEIVAALQKIGFRVLEVRFYNFFLTIGNWMIPPKKIALYLEHMNKLKLSRRFGRNFIIIAQK